MQAIVAFGWDPTKKACVLDIDSSKMNWRHDESFCLTRSRGSTGGFFISNRGRRLSIKEQLRLQAFDPNRIKLDSITERQLAQAAGNAMTVSVIERILLRALPAANLVPETDLRQRWENLSSAVKTLKSMY